MSEHFIREIEIKNFKCFKDFKAEGFGRVNLIGGKNNVGKTAFMEACYLYKSNTITNLFAKLLFIKTHRNIINILISNTSREEDIRDLIKDNIDIYIYKYVWNTYHKHDGTPIMEKVENSINIKENSGNIEILLGDIDPDIPHIYSYKELINILDAYFKNTKYIFDIHFLTSFSNTDKGLKEIIDYLKITDKYDKLNSYLFYFFYIKNIDFIQNRPMLKINNKYKNFSDFGQGIKSFVNIIGSLLLLNKEYLFIDEIENGIHYTLFDKLWEIILTISKEQKVQVFATTHSKECIESYARVSKKLEDNEIRFIELGRNREDEIKALVMDSDRFQREIDMDNEVRGW